MQNASNIKFASSYSFEAANVFMELLPKRLTQVYEIYFSPTGDFWFIPRDDASEKANALREEGTFFICNDDVPTYYFLDNIGAVQAYFHAAHTAFFAAKKAFARKDS